MSSIFPQQTVFTWKLTQLPTSSNEHTNTLTKLTKWHTHRDVSTVNYPIKASSNKGPLGFLRGTLTQNFTFFAISQPRMPLRSNFHSVKKDLDAENALYWVISLPPRPAPMLENLRYILMSVHILEHFFIQTTPSSTHLPTYKWTLLILGKRCPKHGWPPV